jgi:ribosomal protein L7/L12
MPQPAADDPTFQARLLAAGLGLDDDIPPTEAIPAEVIDLARTGEWIPAIRLLRQLRGLGLLQAKRVVDAVTAGEG